MKICPLCNGIFDYKRSCSLCGGIMNIKDKTEAYEDSYSPYLSYNLTDLNDGDPPGVCSHISVCSNCGHKEIVKINMIIK